MCVDCGKNKASLPVVTGPAGPSGDCNCNIEVVKFLVDRLGANSSGEESMTDLVGFDYTVPVGVSNGKYLIDFSAHVDFLGKGSLELESFINDISTDTLNKRITQINTSTVLSEIRFTIPINYIGYVTMSTGDVFKFKSSSTANDLIYLSSGVLRITKIN